MKRTPLPSCPLCSAGPNGVLREVDCRAHPLWRSPLPFLIPWRECQECKHVYADPFDKEAEELLFSHPAHDYQTPLRMTAAEKSEQRYRAWDLVRRMSGYFEKELGGALLAGYGVRWLDIGAGSGALCRTLQELGHDVVAEDVRPGVVRDLQVLGVSASNDVGAYGFDVVSMGDVLEHVVDMKALLQRAIDKVRQGAGILWISMPNCDSWILQDHGDDDPNWAEIEHLHRPTRKRMLALFAELGLELRAVDVSSFYLGALEYFLKVLRPASFPT